MVLSALLFSSGRSSSSRFSLDIGWTTPSLSQPNSNVVGSNWKLPDGAAMIDATMDATAVATLDAAIPQARFSLSLPVTSGEKDVAFALPPVASGVCLTLKPGVLPRLILRVRCAFFLWMRSWRVEVLWFAPRSWRRCCCCGMQQSLI